jgi:hypothetical protein
MSNGKNILGRIVVILCLIGLVGGGYYLLENYDVAEEETARKEVDDPKPSDPLEPDNEAEKKTSASTGVKTGVNQLPEFPEPPPEEKPDIDEGGEGLFKVRVIKTGLRNPGGLAVHPTDTNLLYIAEEDTDRLLVYREALDRLDAVVDSSTPIYESAEQTVRSSQGLTMPEGMAFGPDGYLYVVEDTPGGRLIKFELEEGGERIRSGYVIQLPGDWKEYAWEDVAVGVNGELLLAGSTAQNAGGGDFLDIFVGTIIYKDRNDNWWIPYERKFASFSSVEFSKSGTQAIITGELSGEVSWIDLTTRRRLGGNSEHTARGAEGMCVLPDGSLLIGLEEGVVNVLDPSVDKMKTVLSKLPAVEYLTWDKAGYRALVSDDKSGSIIELTPTRKFDDAVDKMNFATYRSILSQLHIPEDCPPYLAEVLKLGGLDYTEEDKPDISFREFTARVPMVAADAYAKPVPLHNFAKDPIERLQFVVFEPNQITYTDEGVTLSLAGFYARTQSGTEIKSSTKEMAVRRLDVDTQNVIPEGITDFVVPHASSVTVSSTGVAAISFNGLGETADFSIVINPLEPEKSYLAVFHENGERDHYTLTLPDINAISRSWIVAYSNDVNDEWQALKQGRP